MTIALLLLGSFETQLCLFAEVTAFTYQGRLNTDTGSANGLYDFTFSIYDQPTGTGLFAIQTNLATQVSNGLFTVTIDFGPVVTEAIFSGPARWLEIAARTNGAAAYATLSPRQPFTAAPYAITAANLAGGALIGTFTNPVTFNNPASSFSGNGGGLTNVNATMLGGFGYCALPCYWNLGGNAGTTPASDFLGTTDNQPLNFMVNNTTALQLVPGASLPNVVGGRAAFRPSVLAPGVSGVVIAGGNAPSGAFRGFGAGDYMAAFDDDGTIGGGFGNKVGTDNGDTTDAAFATVGGGIFNYAGNFAATVGGGSANTATGMVSVVAGGNGNTASGDYGSIGGGTNNAANAYGSVIGGGDNNQATGPYAAVSGGGFNQASGRAAFIGGGGGRDVSGSGPYGNIATGDWSVVGGGWFDLASGYSSTVGGGAINRATNSYATVPGGALNVAGGIYSFAAGQQANAIHQGSFVWADSQNAAFASTANDQFNVRAQGGAVFVTGTAGMTVNGLAVATSGANTFTGSQTFNGALNINSSGGFDQSSVGTFSIDSAGLAGGRFRVQVNGNVGIGTNNPGAKFVVVPSTVAPPAFCDGLTWFSGSDRNAKEAFVTIEPRAVLEKVASLPITEWRYKEQPGIEHLGPMAQDFHKAFGLNGADDKHISTVDEGGVALAAIQGLNQKLEQTLREKEAHISELERRLVTLEKLVRSDR